jgi:hypothetical protein
MSEALHSIPEVCQRALAAIEADPLELPAEVLTHLHGCPACAEARVHWLALEEAPQALAPAGYFDRLPARILRKLPAKPGVLKSRQKWLWASAAAVLMGGIGLGGFWLGHANKKPLVEATLPRTPSEIQELIPDTPFQENEDAISKLSNLSPEEAEAVLKRVEASQP